MFCLVLVKWSIPLIITGSSAAMTELVKVSDSSPDGENRESSNLSGRIIFIFIFIFSFQRNCPC